MKFYFLKLYDSFSGVGRWASLFASTTWASIRRPPSWTLLLDQFYQVGVLSLPVVAITGFSTGLVLAAQAFYQLGDKGLASATGLLVGKGMLTEIGPVLTAFMVTGRVGSSMTAVIGSMRVTEQIDALKSMAVNPLRYLIAPRIIGGILMLPALTVFSAVMGIFGGYLISVNVFGMTSESYFDPMPVHITGFDFWTGMIKALVFGILISTISCYKGLRTKGGAAGVGKSITNSVVICYSYILIINFLLTIGLNSLHLYFVENFGWR
ncbi:MAG: Intermembrane phospholipid transport system permease protein MlaE [Chlamydiales bacterium]|nr:Intermembrane phospholipid transport system permease protein MlaE [Chlamydiales bacterium]MCH9620126.1 Intermembrane phospholipid transport system permease protein MlaE [Chlamydiales bacterium]MCH9623596.1 Intermembrane phospholipid transport system permease protein MlaE [Chlamydiales bacterium]